MSAFFFFFKQFSNNMFSSPNWNNSTNLKPKNDRIQQIYGNQNCQFGIATAALSNLTYSAILKKYLTS